MGVDSPHRRELNDLVVDLAASAAGLGKGLPEGIHSALADLGRAMNCYYSNLIEGHDITLNPRPAEIALPGKARAPLDAGPVPGAVGGAMPMTCPTAPQQSAK